VDQRQLFAKRLRRLRKAAKLTLDEAGERGGLSGKYWGEVERSEKSPTLEKISEMAKALGVPTYALVQLERDVDEDLLRKRIGGILDKASAKQLKAIYCYLLDTVESD
jgi:transcriptional regulator with XRE-family HTH domain